MANKSRDMDCSGGWRGREMGWKGYMSDNKIHQIYPQLWSHLSSQQMDILMGKKRVARKNNAINFTSPLSLEYLY